MSMATLNATFQDVPDLSTSKACDAERQLLK